MRTDTPTTAALLLAWYDRHYRDLPWRVSPAARHAGKTPDPYTVWLSEIMLQQTTVRAVRPYFATFVQRWPTVDDLAAAGEADVLKAWAGLGYYSRARNLKACADRVAADFAGRFPDTEDALRALPGIGAYTAAAIAAIAFDRQSAVVDGNVERVIARLDEIREPLPAAKAKIRDAVAARTPALRPGDFAQAMMDLGATVCTPKRPACIVCPLASGCAALAAGDPENLPVKAPRREKPLRRGAAFVAVDAAGAVYLTKRGNKGLLAGMSGVPTSAWTVRADGRTDAGAAPFEAEWRAVGQVAHVFTHFALDLTVFAAFPDKHGEPGEGWWSKPDTLPFEALPTVMKKAIAAVLPEAFASGRTRLHNATSLPTEG